MNDNYFQSDFTSKGVIKVSSLIAGQNADIQLLLDGLGIKMISIPNRADDRGSLSFLEFDSGLPFSPQRIFIMSDVPEGKTRGEHAHHQCQQILICLNGSCEIEIDSGAIKLRIALDSLTVGIYLPPMIWSTLNLKNQFTTVLALASLKYDELDYIRDYDEFLKIKVGIKE
jgi:hypothetical protein